MTTQTRKISKKEVKMSKDIKEYTPEELQAIGKRVVEARQKVAAKEAENRKIMKKLWKLYQDGKVKV